MRTPLRLATDRQRDRRQVVKIVAAGALGSVALAACSTLGLPKIAKANAGYEDRAKGKAHCAACVHFQKPQSCTVVEGIISPHGVCRYFLPEAA